MRWRAKKHHVRTSDEVDGVGVGVDHGLSFQLRKPTSGCFAREEQEKRSGTAFTAKWRRVRLFSSRFVTAVMIDSSLRVIPSPSSASTSCGRRAQVARHHWSAKEMIDAWIPQSRLQDDIAPSAELRDVHVALRKISL